METGVTLFLEDKFERERGVAHWATYNTSTSMHLLIPNSIHSWHSNLDSNKVGNLDRNKSNYAAKS